MMTYQRLYWLPIAALISLLSQPLVGYCVQPDVAPPVQATEDTPPGQRIGAPQVLEIDPQPAPEPLREAKPAPVAAPPAASARTADRTEPSVIEKTAKRETLGGESAQPNLPAHRAPGSRNYLGVLYASSEEGPVGVKVLDVVPGSPAERAGFSGANRPSEGQSSLIKAAIVVLAMSPAGPFAIPLAIAHDMYMSHQTPGDLIVAINDQPVHNAQEFSETMRRYQPRETVSFSILRAGKSMQLSVQLEEEPG